jgi:protein-L-isoaspartate O-methyltransferase
MAVTGIRRLVLAAHFDDAILSCWAAIGGAADGVEVTVATVFAGAPPAGVELADWDRAAGAGTALEAWEVRRAEDKAVLVGARARAVHLPFVDAQYRSGPVPRAAVAVALNELVQNADEVWLPAGIGNHPDHLLVAEIGLQLSGLKSRHLYADLPYAAAEWSELLSAARRGRHDARSLRVQLDVAPSAPPLGVPAVTQLSAEEQERKRESVLAYESQTTPLVGAFGRWFEDPLIAAYELSWDAGPGRRAGRPIDTLLGKPTPSLPDPDSGRFPFLTVLVRTVMARQEQLAAALTSLAGQSCTDFEVILLQHTPTRDAAQSGWPAPQIPEALADRTRIIPVRGGFRGHPLNVGIDQAAGTYVAILDDDDIALEDWVATFRAHARQHPGAVLRCQVRSERFDHDTGQWGPEVTDWPEAFDLLQHLKINSTPTCGLAYPTACFTELQLRFDESLPVVEDWDLLLQAAAFCGVSSSAHFTSVYRRWGRGDDSLAMHSRPEWEAAMRAVTVKANQRPLLLPAGSVNRIRRDQDLVVELQRRQTELHEQNEQLIRAHDKHLEQISADHEHHVEIQRAAHEQQLRDAMNNHQHELTALRERFDGQVAESIAQNTRMFHQSTSWKITAPIRALGALRLRLAERRRSTGVRPPAQTNQTTAVDTPPPSGISLKPPPNPGVQTWPAAQFDELYEQHPDPWGYATSWYEQRKYAITVACLPKKKYHRAFEPGCSVGVLSELLAERTEYLISADFSATALLHARRRLSQYPHIHIRQMTIPTQWPDATFDLIVISEIATYLSDDDLSMLIRRTTDSLEPEGTLIIVHFRPPAGTPHTASDVHQRFRQEELLTSAATHEEEDFLLDVFHRSNTPDRTILQTNPSSGTEAGSSPAGKCK